VLSLAREPPVFTGPSVSTPREATRHSGAYNTSSGNTTGFRERQRPVAPVPVGDRVWVGQASEEEWPNDIIVKHCQNMHTERCRNVCRQRGR